MDTPAPTSPPAPTHTATPMPTATNTRAPTPTLPATQTQLPTPTRTRTRTPTATRAPDPTSTPPATSTPWARPGAPSADVITVCASGCEFATIQGAIDDTETGAGDVIWIADAITAANAIPESIPKTATATAIASSKLLLAAVNESVTVFE